VGGHAEFALGLVDHGVDVNARDFDELTPLHIALKGGHVEISWLLVEHDSDVSATSVPFQRRSTLSFKSHSTPQRPTGDPHTALFFTSISTSTVTGVGGRGRRESRTVGPPGKTLGIPF